MYGHWSEDKTNERKDNRGTYVIVIILVVVLIKHTSFFIVVLVVIIVAIVLKGLAGEVIDGARDDLHMGSRCELTSNPRLAAESGKLALSLKSSPIE